MFRTFSKSFQLVKESFAVLRKDKEMMLFPIISSIATIIVFLSFIIPFNFLIDTETGSITNNLFYVFLFAFYLVTNFIIIFFNTGLITCAHIRLKGGDPTFSDGINNALRHIRKIFVWALISATVGVILKTLADRSKNTIGRLVIAFIGMAWSLLTFFVIPVMILEEIDVIASIKKSGSLFKKTWGENVIGQFSMGAFFMILGIAGFFIVVLLLIIMALLIGAIGTFIISILLFALLVLYWVLLGIISSSLNGIFVTALYHYANTGNVPSAYSLEFIKNSFKQKETRFSRGII